MRGKEELLCSQTCTVGDSAPTSVQSLAKHVQVAGELSVVCVEVEAGIAARAEAQRGDGAAAGGRRLLRDRAVARS